jgi:hypothetical protein
MLNTKLLEFLGLLSSQREVALVIAQANSELEDFTQTLNQAQYSRISDLNGLLDYKEDTKGYIVLDSVSPDLLKQVYDFTTQYPTGQISLNDGQGKTIMVSPNYLAASLILVVSKEQLERIQSQFNFLSVVGLSYQN